MKSYLPRTSPHTKFLSLFSGSIAGAGWMLLACLMFTLLAVTIRYAGKHLAVQEIVFYRNLIAVISSGYVLYRSKITPFTPQWKWALLLGVAAAFSNWTYGYGLVHLPFSTANALNYTHPLFMAILGILIFKSRIDKAILISLGIAFAGVLLLLQPKSLPPEQWQPGLIALFSGASAGLLNLLVHYLGFKGEPSSRIVFYFSLVACTAMLFITLNNDGFHPITGVIWIYIPLLGFFSTSAQFLLVRAFQDGHPNITSLFSYSTVLYAVILDLLIFQKQHFNPWSAAGIALIIGGGLVVTWLNPGKKKTIQPKD